MELKHSTVSFLSILIRDASIPSLVLDHPIPCLFSHTCKNIKVNPRSASLVANTGYVRKMMNVCCVSVVSGVC